MLTLIWCLAGLGFILTFFTGGGPGTFPEDSGRHLLGAVFMALGFGGHGLAWWLTRQRKGDPPLTDERDFQVAARASQATLVVVLMVIFGFLIGLWVAFENEGSVPAGWMWFLAYGEAVLAYVTSGVATLILDGRTGGHG